MKFKKLFSVCLSAAICAASLSGCAQRSEEIPLESSNESNVISTETSEPAESAGTPEETASSGTLTASTSTESSSIASSSTASSSIASSSTASSSITSTSTASSPTQSSSSNEPNSHQHTYTAKTVAPTCAESGYTLHACSCGDQYTTDTVNALGHDCSSSLVEPTCTASGYTRYTCKQCGYEYKDNYTNALGHKYSSHSVGATCDHNGYTLHSCERCGSEYKDSHTHAHGHHWGEWTVTQSATASSAGEQRRECSDCGKTETQTIPQIRDVSAYASEVVRLVNAERAKYGLAPLSENKELAQYAYLRSTELVVKWGHTRPDGSNPLHGFEGQKRGENIANGYSTPEAVMNGWMNSEGHRANILDSEFNMIGVGCYEKDGKLYWTQIFAKR